CRALACNDAEHEEDAAAQQIEADNLAQRIGMDQQAVKAQADERRACQSGESRCRHGNGRSTGSRVGGPTTSRGRIAATESTMKASMNRISGLASPAGEARNPAATADPRTPTKRKIAGPATETNPNPPAGDARPPATPAPQTGQGHASAGGP